MVTRLVLLIILGFAAALYFPDSRQMIISKAMPVIQPVLIGSAEREIEELSLSVRREARGITGLPPTRSWDTWLLANFHGDATTDPWGKRYSYQAWADSFVIQSDGPDGRRGSADDIRVSHQRPF